MRVLCALLGAGIVLGGCNTTESSKQAAETEKSAGIQANKPAKGLSGPVLKAYNDYRNLPSGSDYKAFYFDAKVNTWGVSWNYLSATKAVEAARNDCEKIGKNCQPYAIGPTIVYQMEEGDVNRTVARYHIKKPKNDSWKMKNAHGVGKLVGYSELCSEYSGSGISKLYLRDIKQKFKGVAEFSKGYDVFAGYNAYDTVALSDCKSVNETLVKIKPLVARLP